MKRRNFSLTMVGLATGLLLSTSQAAMKTAVSNGDPARQKVPIGMTYIVVDNQGRQTRSFKSGEATPLDVDCVQIRCPKTIQTAGGGKTVR